MVDISLENFERAGRVGRRLRVREEEGQKELLWTSNTLFGRAVAWIRDIFSGSREQEERIAAEAFFREIKREYGVAAEAAARSAAWEKWTSGTPLRKLVGPSIELARATRSAQEKNRRASNLEKAEAFAVSEPRFAQACKAVGVQHRDLSLAQLELADALIRFEAAATTDRKIDEPELRTIAEQAALMAHVFDEAAGTIWYDGDTTLDQALRQLVEWRPYAVALLGAGALERVRNAAEEILPVIKEDPSAETETENERLRKIAALLRVEGEISELRSDVVHPMDGVSEVDGVHVTYVFKADWHRQATSVEIEAAESTGEKKPDSEDVLGAIHRLAGRSPAVARATRNRDALDALNAFAENVGSWTGREHHAAVKLPPYAVKGKEPDGPLILTATRHGPDDHVMINATMGANLQNSDRLEDVVQELLSFVRAEDGIGDQDKDRVSPEEDKRIVSQLTRIVHQGLYLGLLEEIRERGGKVAWGSPVPAEELRGIALTRNGSDGFVIDVQYGRKSRADSAAVMASDGMPLVSDEQHGYQGRMRLSVSRESLRKGEPFVTLLEPIKYTVAYTPDPDALAAEKAALEKALPKPRGQEDEPTFDRIQYRNLDLLGQAYIPGGARAEEAWKRAGAIAGEFSTMERDAIKLLAWDVIEEVGRHDGDLNRMRYGTSSRTPSKT